MADEPIVDALNPFPKRDGESDREARIRRRAHEIWEAAGRPEGREQEHWFAAEREFVDLERPDPSMGTPTVPGEDVPAVRGPDGDRNDEPAPPKTAGAPQPAPDTSKSPLANRDLEGHRKAGATPRPTGKPIVG